MNEALLMEARRELGRLPAVLEALLAGLDEAGARTRPAPGEWAEERRYSETSLPVVLEALRVRRRQSLDLLASVAADRLTGSRPHRRLGRLSGLDILAAWVAHDRIHLSQLAGTLARIWAVRWSPLRAEYAGPIPYPPNPAQ